MSLLFVKINLETNIFSYVEYTPTNNFLRELSGCFTVKVYDTYFVAVRSILSEKTKPNGPDSFFHAFELHGIDIEAIKIDFNGALIDSKVFSTNIQDFGLPFYEVYPNSFGLSNLKVDRHYDDLIVSPSNSIWSTQIGDSPYGANFVIDTKEFKYLEPFIIKATKFTGGIDGSLPLITSWCANGSNCRNRPYSGLSGFKSGGLSFTLFDDYSGADLIAWNVPGENYNYKSGLPGYKFDGSDEFRFINKIRDSGLKTHYAGSVNSSKMFKLPEDSNQYLTVSDNKIKLGEFSPDIRGDYWDLLKYQDYWAFYTTNELPLEMHGKNGSGISSSKSAYFKTDANGQHPGCTLPASNVIEEVEVRETVEPVEIIKKAIPQESYTEYLVSSGEGSMQVMPYYNRAPVLCSEYKVNIDQILSLKNTEGNGIRPMLDSVYERTLTLEPTNGVYDPIHNIYRPNTGFIGNDIFEILIDDKTGDTQTVTIEVNVY